MVHICTQFHENILDGIKVIERIQFSKENFQRGIIQNVGGFTVLVFCHRLMMVYICTKFHENSLNSMKVIERTRFSQQNFQRGIIPLKIWVELRFFFSAHRLMVVYI